MCWNWFRKKEKNIVIPQKGIVLFVWDSSFYQVLNCNPKHIRLITNQSHPFPDTVSKITWLLGHGISLMVNVPTIPLAESLSRMFGSKISLQYKNEVNGGPDGYVSPEDYMGQFKEFSRIVRGNGSQSIMSGLNCEERNVKSYFKKLIPLGIREETDKYILHHYYNQSQYKDILSYMRKTAPEKEVQIGEYGKNSAIEDIKITSIDKYLAMFGSDKITRAYLYAWQNGENWGIHNQPKVIVHYAQV